MQEEKKDNVWLFSNHLTRFFEPIKIRGMFIALSKKPTIKVTRKTVKVNSYIGRDKIRKKLNPTILMEMNSAISYLEEEVKNKEEKHHEVKKIWLKILNFARENNQVIVKIQENPLETEDEFNKLFQKAEEAIKIV